MCHYHVVAFRLIRSIFFDNVRKQPFVRSVFSFDQNDDTSISVDGYACACMLNGGYWMLGQYIQVKCEFSEVKCMNDRINMSYSENDLKAAVTTVAAEKKKSAFPHTIAFHRKHINVS